MWAFFKGWRRKVGVVVLVMACVVMVGWVRSQIISDDLKIPFPLQRMVYGVASFGGGLDFYRRRAVETGWGWRSDSPEYSSYFLTEFYKNGIPREITPWNEQHEIEWRKDLLGFHLGVSRLGGFRDTDFMIPYWSIVLPLTLFSAYLLLWKPRLPQSSPVIQSPKE